MSLKITNKISKLDHLSWCCKNSTSQKLSLKFYWNLPRTNRKRGASFCLCLQDTSIKPLPFALCTNDKLDVGMKANMFLHCFLRQVIISLSSMSCCNQALTRFANNLKGIAYPRTLQIKTRPEQNWMSAARQLHSLWERAVHELKQQQRGHPSLICSTLHFFIFYWQDVFSAPNPGNSLFKTMLCSYLKCPDWL